MGKYLLIDVATQKKFVESFGSEAVPFAPAVRENLMHITSAARQLKLPVLSVLISGENPEMDEKVMDTLMEGGNQTFVTLNDLAEMKSLEEYDAIFVYGIGVKWIREVLEICSGVEAKLWLVEDAIKDWEESEENKLLEDMKESYSARKITTRNLDKYLRI